MFVVEIIHTNKLVLYAGRDLFDLTTMPEHLFVYEDAMERARLWVDVNEGIREIRIRPVKLKLEKAIISMPLTSE